MDSRDEFGDARKTVSLIGISIIVSLFIYLALAEIIRTQLRPFRGFGAFSNVQSIRYAFFVGAIVAVIAVRLLRQRLLKRSPQDTDSTVLRKLQRTTIITLALSEIPGLLGLILFLLCGLNVDFYLLLLVSLVLVFMYFPRRDQWGDWLKK